MDAYPLKPQTRYLLRAGSDTPQIVELHHSCGQVDHVLLPFDAFRAFTITPMKQGSVIYGPDLVVRAKRWGFRRETAQREAERIFYQSRFAAPLRFGGCIYSCQRPRKGLPRQSLIDNRGMDLGSESVATLMSSEMICDQVPTLPSYGSARYSGSLRLCVVLHLHYTELWPEFATFFAHSLPDFKLIVTLTEPDATLEAAITAQFPDAIVRVVDNLGRDILPFLKVLSEGHLDGSDLICKVHGKRSVLSSVKGSRFGHLWRRRNLLDLLGSPEQVNTILRDFESREHLGMMGSAPLRLRNSGGIDPGFEATLEVRRTLSEKSGVDPGCIADDFFAGTMFWVRRAALEPLKRIPFEAADFTDEDRQVGDQFEHGVERFFSDSVRASGLCFADTEPLALSVSEPAPKQGKILAPHGLFLGRNDGFEIRWSVPLLPSVAGMRVALMAVTSSELEIPAHTRYLLEALKTAGYVTVLCLACPEPKGDATHLQNYANAVFLRDIGGFDMALWGAVLRAAPQLWNACELLFVTDAVLGPFSDPVEAFGEFNNASSDCLAAFQSEDMKPQISRHLFALYPKALAHVEVRAFFQTALCWAKERESIFRYEARLRSVLEEACGLSVGFIGDQHDFVTVYDVLSRNLSKHEMAALSSFLGSHGRKLGKLEHEILAEARDLLLDHGVQSQLAVAQKHGIRKAFLPT